MTVPLLMPALVSGWLLAFTLSLDDVVVASFTSGPGATTLPMLVFSATRLGVTPEIYALATVIVVVVAAGLAVAARRPAKARRPPDGLSRVRRPIVTRGVPHGAHGCDAVPRHRPA